MEFETGDKVNARELGDLLSHLAGLYSLVDQTYDINERSDSDYLKFANSLGFDISNWPVVSKIRQQFVDNVASGMYGNALHLNLRDALKKFINGSAIYGDDVEYEIVEMAFGSFTYEELEITSISLNSPLKINLKGVTMLLIACAWFSGGEFSIGGKDGIHVRMPGVGETIKIIHDTIFPLNVQQLRNQLIEAYINKAENDALKVLENADKNNQ